MVALTQIRMRGSVGRAYYDSKIADGKTHNEAMRCLKRRLADHVWRLMIRDERTSATGSGRTLGGGSEIHRGWFNPDHQLFGQVTSRTRHPRLYDHLNRRLDKQGGGVLMEGLNPREDADRASSSCPPPSDATLNAQTQPLIWPPRCLGHPLQPAVV